MTTIEERRGEGARGREGHRGEVALGLPGAQGPAVPLEQPTAALPLLAGSKAANLARAARAGLPVLPGFVITRRSPHAAARRAWHELSDGGTRPLVVRSSSTQEDTHGSSLAGQFASVLDVRGWEAFRTAVRTVLDSAHRPDGSTAPMAVLVQPMLVARVGGVMFGADPVEGRADRMLVSAVRGGPDRLVGGAEAGTNYWLSRSGRLLRTEPPGAGSLLSRSELVRLARLTRRARRVFGGPQDIEFGFDEGGRLWLFQSRPITAMAARPPRGARLLGPGPVAETLPEQLQPLEEDLWVAPMARGLAAALDLGGSAPRRLLRTVPVATTVGGRPAADLRLLGVVPPRHRWLALLNPAPGGRRLAAAWRLGRLTAALPGLATDLVADVDRYLAEIPAPAELPGPDLVGTLRWTRRLLVSLHAQEALAGALLHEPPKSRTAAGTALTALAEARARGVPNERVVVEAPVVLALTAPSLRGRVRLPGQAGRPTRDAYEPTKTGRSGEPERSVEPGRLAALGYLAALGRSAESGHLGESGRPGEPRHHTEHGHLTEPTWPAEPGHLTEPRQPGEPRHHTEHGHLSRLANLSKPRPLSEPGHLTEATGPTEPEESADTTGPTQPDGPAHTTPTPTRSAPPDRLHTLPLLPPREALRLRIRWVQELQVRLVREATRRLELAPGQAALLRWRELVAALGGGPLPADLGERVPRAVSPPLPDAFRLADGGAVVAERTGRRSGNARGVSGGRAVGTAWDGTGLRPADPVLVVRTLDPALAPLLPGLAGLVAQTGSPLSHLAVLAREFGLPAVVGAMDAVRRFPPGSRLTIDGTTGDVQEGDVR